MFEIYEVNKSNTQRYAYGSKKAKSLFVLGLNPSCLPDTNLNPTLRNARAFSKILGFDSFIMINIYPQRSTDPDLLHKRMSKSAHEKNIDVICSLLSKNDTIWAAWGGLIDKRSYLYKCLEEINKSIEDKNVDWIRYDSLTKQGHPRHPMYKKHEDRFERFDMEMYLKKSRA